MTKLPRTRAFLWKKRHLLILDQRELPHRVVWRTCRNEREVAQAIRQMVVRGAPAIGITAAYGIVLAALSKPFRSMEQCRSALTAASKLLLEARPTAVNLRWALDRMGKVWKAPFSSIETLARTLELEAVAIESEDRAGNEAMGRFGAALLAGPSTVLTHCNTGSLATAGLGTAFGVIWTAFQDGKVRKVIATETRPYLQGARLTTWELKKEGIPFELITDNMAAHIMNSEKINAIFVGADRIAANGDAANKIGTYSLAVLAMHHQIPFYVVAPLSTVDLSTSSGEGIPIEERSIDEVTNVRGSHAAGRMQGRRHAADASSCVVRITPKGIKVRHPAFDVSPASMIAAIVTDRGVARPPYIDSLPLLFSNQAPANLPLKAVA